MKGKQLMINIFRYARKTIFWLTTFIASLLLITLLLLQTSFFQNYLTDFVLEKVNQNTRQTAKITNIKIKWFDFVEIKGIELRDYMGKRMIHAASLDVDYQLNQLLADGNLLFDKVTIESGELALVGYEDSLNINLVEFINDIRQLLPTPADTVKSAPTIGFNNIRLNDFYFSYDNKGNDSLPSGYFDYRHFRLDIPAASILNFTLHRDTIQAFIRSFEAKDMASGFQINKLKSNFQISNAGLILDELLLETSNSVIRDYIEFNFSGMNDLGTFVDSVQLETRLIGVVISKQDIDYFARIPVDNFKVDISARVSGSIPRLSINDLRISTGSQTHLYGKVDLWGLPKIEETFIDARIDDGELFHGDLKPFIKETASRLNQLGTIDFSGTFLGFTNDFVANAEFQTAQGDISSDLNLKFPNKWENASYSGQIALNNFNVGAILQDTSTVGRVNMNGTIKGKGLTQRNARFYLNSSIERSSFFGYTYDKIVARGEFASEFFQGEVKINDDNCVVRVNGNINLAKGFETINAVSSIDTLDLFKLGFSKVPLRLSTSIKSDINGLNIDSLQGTIVLEDLSVTFKDDSIGLDLLEVSSFRNAGHRNIDISLPDIDLSMDGDFLFSTLVRDLTTVTNELQEYFTTDYEKRKILLDNDEEFDQYAIDFSFNYKDINKYIQLFTNELYLSEYGKMEGTYYQRRNATLSLYAEIDSINYQGIGYNNNIMDLNLSKDLDSMGIIASAYLLSEEQVWRNIDRTENLELEGVWFNNKIGLNFNIDQPATNSSAQINAEMELTKDQLQFRFLPSRVLARDQRWYFNPYNQININSQNIRVERLELYQNEQSILMKGVYSDSLDTDMSIQFTDFDLSILNTILPTKVAGILNAQIDLNRDDNLDPFKLASQLNVQGLGVSGFEVGDMDGKTSWDPKIRGLNIDLDIIRQSVKTVAVAGYYYPQDTLNQLDIQSEFNGAEMGLLQPLFTGLFSNLRGYADGNVSLSGSLSRPVLNGNTNISEGRMTFDYLGTTYGFEGGLNFDNRAINFQAIRLTDRDGDKASLSGKISHAGFRDFDTDIRIAASNFSFLNTTKSDNSLYYGTANASGNISISGPFQDLVINANATTEKGTRIFIPLTSDSDVTQKDYISFVDFSDTTDQVNLQEIVSQNISGVRLNFDIDVTTDAYVELIFNIRTGDIIRGKGNGNLNLQLDTNGEFELFGDLTITEGAYNFTIPNFINKEFVVVPGSTISWYGDPYAGVLNLDATYRQLASFEDFRGSANADVVSQKYPVLVVLKLQGEMLSPAIDFEIRMDETQTAQSTDQQIILQAINNDESELKRQVFSLLILRKFTPEQGFSVGAASAGVNSSVSEFLSNQFSYFISQVDENLEVDVDLSSLDANAFNAFQLRFSYSFLDGRLKVSGGGTFPQQSAEDASATSFIGDWSVRYLLTSDGHLRVKAFSQSEQIAGAQQRETGVSFQYVKSFDDFKELLQKSREESIKTKPKDVSKEREANTSAGT